MCRRDPDPNEIYRDLSIVAHVSVRFLFLLVVMVPWSRGDRTSRHPVGSTPVHSVEKR